MRKLLISVAVAGLLAACGGGDDDPEASDTDSTGGSSTTATTAPADGSSTTVTIAPGGSPDPNATPPSVPTLDTTPIDPTTVETLPPPPDPGPTDPGFAPAAPGQYAYTATGMAAGRPVNETQTFTVTPLAANEIRYAAPEQILDLQYRPDGIYLRQLVAKFASETITFQSAEGVLLIPNPQDAGRTWDWSLTDSTGGLTATWHGSTLPAETVAAGGTQVTAGIVEGTIAINGRYNVPVIGMTDVAGTVAIRLWFDPAPRLPVQLHQVTTISKPAIASGLGADTTYTYAGFTPA